MKKMITLFAVLGMVLALAPTAQAGITTVLLSVDGAAYYDGTGTDYGLGNFVLDDALNVGGATGYFKQKYSDSRGFSAADVLTDGNILKGAQYVSTLVGVNTYQVTLDEAGTFYLLSENRGSFDPTGDGYTDTGVDIAYSQWSLTFSVWSKAVSAGTVTTPTGYTGSFEPMALAFVPTGDPPAPTGTLIMFK